MNSPTKKPKELYICWDDDDLDEEECNVFMTTNINRTKQYDYMITVLDNRADNKFAKNITTIVLE